MEKYVRPIVVVNDEVSEGVYAASGARIQYSCDSIYMNGVYHHPTYNPLEDGYKIGRGCEGCPAWTGDSCRFDTAPEQMNWDGDFRPTWEVDGKLPDDKGV
ncbi:MAG: hypothetical protein IJ282_10175 [Lachnospiraceae bacterium]|nr:hypothetical protein [Lachnospiraceae bacterium]